MALCSEPEVAASMAEGPSRPLQPPAFDEHRGAVLRVSVYHPGNSHQAQQARGLEEADEGRGLK